MDGISCQILDKICQVAPFGKYVVISADEFFECFPEGAEKSYTELKKALKTLVSGGFIDVKYSDGELFCTTPLKKYVPEPEPELYDDYDFEDVAVEPVKIRAFMPAFWGALLGGTLGSFIISLVFAIL